MAKKKLSEIIIRREKVYLDDEDFIEVRGLSLADLSELFSRHTSAVTQGFDQIVKNHVPGQPVDLNRIEGVIYDTLEAAPSLVGDIISTAMDEPESAAMATKLPGGIQVQALKEIAQLSITSEAELKKVLGALTTAIRTLVALIQENKTTGR